MSDAVLIAAIVAVSNAVTNGIGFRAVGKELKALAHELGEKLKNKIDVSQYSAKTSELHGIINTQSNEIVALKLEVAHLKGKSE